MATNFTGSYSENFDTLVSTGTSTILPAEWILAESGTNANATYTAGSGTSNGVNYTLGILQGVSVGSLSATDFISV